MAFYHCEINVPKDDLRNILIDRYSLNIAMEWFKIYDFIHENLARIRDNVQIYKPNY